MDTTFKEFVKEYDYQKISFQKDGILYYKGRILAIEKINASCEMSTVVKDLCSNTFCVPVIYKHSTLAYNLINEIHWHSDTAKHSGVETVWRCVMKLGYIMQGRGLVKKVKKNCDVFADDTTLYRQCKVKGITENAKLLEANINGLESWSENSSLVFNTDKIKTILFSTRQMS